MTKKVLRLAALLVLLVAVAGLLPACGAGALAGGLIGAGVGTAIGAAIDDPYYYDPYYYKVGPAEYEEPF